MLPSHFGGSAPGSLKFALTEDDPAVTEETPAQNTPENEVNAPLFYTMPEPLVRTGHKDLKVRPEWDFKFAKDTNTIPITSPEFAMAARHYPIILIGETLVPVIAVGMVAGMNLFINEDGTWENGFYVPAYARRYPFILLGKETDERLQIGVDSKAKSDHAEARALFKEDGEETEAVKLALTISEQFHQAYLFTAELAKAVSEAGIVEDRSIEVEVGPDEHANMGSFKAVSEEKLRELPDETFLDWRKKGFLPAIYFHLQSLTTWQNLIDRTAARGENLNGAGPAANT